MSKATAKKEDAPVKEFETELERITAIILRIKHSLSIVQELTRVGNDEDVNFIKAKNPFLFFSQVAFWQMTVLDLSKLFVDSDNEKFNLNKFLRKLKPDGHYRKIKELPTIVQKWQSEIAGSKTLINHLKDQRDTTYAHEDTETIINTASVQETLTLYELTFSITSELHNFYYGAELTFRSEGSPVISLEEIVELLTTKRKEYLAPLRAEAEKYGLNDE